MNGNYSPFSQGCNSIQSFSSASVLEADYDDDNVVPVLREEDPDIEAKLDQIFGIESRAD